MRLQIVRFLETFRRVLSWIKTEVLFLYMFRIELLFIFSFITCHSRILQCVEFKNFCSFAVCCSLSITCARNAAEYRLNEFYRICFQLFVYDFIFLLKKWPYLKYDRVLLYSNDRLVGFSTRTGLFEPEFVYFFLCKVVSCCITVSSVKGYRLLSYVYPQSLTVKFSFRYFEL